MSGLPNGAVDLDDVKAVLERIGLAWRSGRTADMAADLDPDVVMVQPGFETAVRGRDACIASYAEFTAMATIESYTESEATIEVRGDTAVAWSGWRMSYTMAGRGYDEAGHEVWVLARSDGRWRAIWRTLTLETPPARP